MADVGDPISGQATAAAPGEAGLPPGLSSAEARRRLGAQGPNTLPEPRRPSLGNLFLRQFLSPLIYILLVAALVSLALGDARDALFIAVVLLINGIIGTVQEYSAGRAAAALRDLEVPRASVIRDGAPHEIDARELVPGDLVLLEAGARVPADIRLAQCRDLRCDESLLTGESRPVQKTAAPSSADVRQDMVYAGSMIVRGRGHGVVIATGGATAIGGIAREVGRPSLSKPPLILRLERLSRMIAIAVGAAILLLVAVGLLRDTAWHDMFMLAVGLAVSAIPEGLPVAISVALAIAMRRMARVNVIVRKMPAVEALGSCTLIATDKTGTLTLNELTVTDIVLPDGTRLACETGPDIDSCAIVSPHGDAQASRRAAALLQAAVLPNEGRLLRQPDGWQAQGDRVDTALLTAARKGGIAQEQTADHYPLIARIPYEPDRKYSASFHRREGGTRIFVKGAPETLIAMADRMAAGSQAVPVDRGLLLRQKEELAGSGLRVLAFAEGEMEATPDHDYGHHHLVNLTFLGMAGMQDPVRPEVPDAIRDCYRAGIEVAMVTGDDPHTASVIARRAGFAVGPEQVVTGEAVRRAEQEGQGALDRLTRSARIFARVDPAQKLAIALSLARNGHFVAVTGDGINDAPALRHAHVGVAMGRTGTDVAKESADIVITDDNFASLVKGILEGRIAYANIRKVVSMLISTGAAEVILFLLAIPMGLPMPLLAVQLLWLNLVTNGIQDVALATEAAEGDELRYPPRRPDEPILDRALLRRVWYSALVMGVGGFAAFAWLLDQGYSTDAARNLLLLLFVCFENFQTFNCRSERHSILHQRLFANPLLALGVAGAQALHIGAMYIPGLNDTLRLTPVSLREWGMLLAVAATLPALVELEKWWLRRTTPAR